MSFMRLFKALLTCVARSSACGGGPADPFLPLGSGTAVLEQSGILRDDVAFADLPEGGMPGNVLGLVHVAVKLLASVTNDHAAEEA